MKKNENFIKWTPIPSLKKKYKTDIIKMNKQSFEIILIDYNEKQQITINFHESVEIFRLMETELFSLELNENKQMCFQDLGPFLKIENSKYVTWLNEESLGVLGYDYTHFKFMTSNYIIDVITNYEPNVKIN